MLYGCTCENLALRAIWSPWWGVCDVCHRCYAFNKCADSIEHTRFIECTLGDKLTEAERCRILLDRLLLEVRAASSDAETTGYTFLYRLESRKIPTDLAKATLWLLAALGPAPVLAWIWQQTVELDLLETIETGGFTSLIFQETQDSDSERSLIQQRAAELATACAVAAWATSPGSDISTQALLMCRDLAGRAGPFVSPDSVLSRLLKPNPTPITCEVFENNITTRDLMLSALWLSHNGLESKKSDLLYVLAPPAGLEVPYSDSVYWGAFDFNRIIKTISKNTDPLPELSIYYQ